MLRDAADRLKNTVTGARLASVLANACTRRHFDVEEDKLVQIAASDSKASLEFSDQALTVMKKNEKMNLAYHELVRQRAP